MSDSINESAISNATFTPSLTTPWLKANFNLSSKRLSGSVPNLLLGLIPIGKREFTYPLKNVSGILVSTKFYLSRLIIGLILISVGLSSIKESFIIGILILLFGASTLVNCLTTSFLISNSAGQKEGYQLSILDKNSVKDFVDKVNNTVAGI